MKERESFQEPTREERLFDVLYGYPMVVAEQVIERNLFDDEINQAIRGFHQNRLDFVKGLLEQSDEREEGLQTTSRGGK